MRSMNFRNVARLSSWVGISFIAFISRWYYIYIIVSLRILPRSSLPVSAVILGSKHKHAFPDDSDRF